MASSSHRRVFGLHQVFPLADAAANSNIESVTTFLNENSWLTRQHRRDPWPGYRVATHVGVQEEDGTVVDWLADPDMLPAVVPNARIFTYDWDANYFRGAPVETLLGHGETLLSHVAQRPGPDAATRPLIFVASCFGGLVLAQAVVRAAQEGSEYRDILLATVGIAFLATPFRGSAAAHEAQWQVIVGGIMQEQTSKELIDDLYEQDRHLRDLTRTFAELARHESVQLSLYCFYELKKTKILRRFLSSKWANVISKGVPGSYKILVSENSACLDTVPRLGLDATHSGMNKFGGPRRPTFQLVQKVIRGFVDQASSILERRKKSAHQPQWSVPFERNGDFVGRREMMDRLLDRVPPDVERDHCQRTTIEGLGGVGKTQMALETAYRVRDQYPNCSVFWVPAVDVTSFENAYREIGQKLQVAGIEEDGADIKSLVKNAMNQERCGSWLLIIDNADGVELLSGAAALCDYLPSSPRGSIMFTTRNHEAVAGLDISPRNMIMATEMSDIEALEMVQKNLEANQTRDGDSTTALLKLLAHLPLAIKQASAYMAKTGMSTTSYLHHCRSSDQRLINLLSQETQYHGRYKGMNNSIATTWLVSFNHILRDKPLAAEILQMISFLVEKDIPISLFWHGEDELAVDEAIGTLKAYAFITEREDLQSFDVHRLVQLAMRNWLRTEGQQQRWIEETIQRLADVFPFPKHENKEVWRPYLPHALSAVSFQKNLSLLGKYREAELTYRQALDPKKKVLGEEHPSALDSMNNLALVLEQQGKYEEAAQIFG
ncbi:hypothetical protein LTS03_011272 [Exophiala xenobiotica]|nr:hypothetical protein LTR72_011756 [Exophiala xenobiotica]KAK5243198.1 hypothetical protein LTS06_010980 [Exophiala xenobiotica]KAK5358455.1 hypothetical protein LTS03_011272 [Exophiala xenobiotica]KAK5550759.1 hypothetical protein LTR46_011231 [Exophiala xenobiotica]